MAVTSRDSPVPPDGAKLLVGTGGYAYTEWVTTGFYAEGTPTAAMLERYARRFPAVELNTTGYRMPRADSLDRQRRQVSPVFRFAAKLNRALTHDVPTPRWRDDAARYREGVAPLVQAGQLAAVLVQFPLTFDRSEPHRRYLSELLDALTGLPLAVEFRHRSWASDRVFAELERRQVALVAVDAPPLPELFPPLAIATTPAFFYARFHGRNLRGWRSGNLGLQFDYRYSDDELQRWAAERIVPLSRRTRSGFIFFGNHVRAQAPADARRFMAMLTACGLDVMPPAV